MFELEQRVLYDASPIAAVMQPNAIDVIEPVDISDLIMEESVADGSLSGFNHSLVDLPLNDELNDVDSHFDPELGFDTTEDTTRQLVVIDSGVDNYEQLIASLDGSTRVLLLDSNQSGIEQISEALQSSKQSFEAVHIVSHGTDGGVQLGNQWLDSNSLPTVANELSQWTHQLSSDADVLFYGCNLAETESGEEFIDSIAALTGADVAASDDITGNADLGGDWDFEYTAGLIETNVAFSQEIQSSYQGIFATVTVDSNEDVVSGDTSSIANLIANDGGDGISLREAVIAANNTAGADQIFVGDGTFTFTLTGNSEDLAATGDLDITEELTIVGADQSTTFIDANGLDRVFDVHAQTLTLKNLTVTGGSGGTAGGGGIRVDGGSLNAIDVTVTGNSATVGGGISFLGSAAATQLNLDGVTVSDNSAVSTVGSGGGVYISDATGLAATTIANSVFFANTSGNTGGGLSIKHGGSVEIVNTTLSGNTSGNTGGGIYHSQANTALTNVTISDNIAGNSGGGLRVPNGTVDVQNSIIAGNSANQPEIAGTINSLGNNIIGDNPNDTNGGSGYHDDDLLNRTDLDLGPLQDNGGRVLTMELLAGSVGIDGGNNAAAPDQDNRGFYREDGNVDIGAFELDATPPLDAGLVAHFEFEEGSGTTIVDSSVTQNDGSINSFGTYTNDSAVGGQAIDFAGDDSASNTFIRVPDNPAYDFGTDDFSISLFYNMTTPSETVHLVGNYNGSSGSGFRVAATAGGQIIFQRADNGTVSNVTATAPLDGQYHHLAVSIESGEATIFIDGAELSSFFGGGTATDVTTTSPLTIGAVDGVDDDYEGLLDDVRIYARTLTTSDIASLQNPPKQTDLAGKQSLGIDVDQSFRQFCSGIKRMG